MGHGVAGGQCFVLYVLPEAFWYYLICDLCHRTFLSRILIGLFNYFIMSVISNYVDRNGKTAELTSAMNCK